MIHSECHDCGKETKNLIKDDEGNWLCESCLSLYIKTLQDKIKELNNIKLTNFERIKYTFANMTIDEMVKDRVIDIGYCEKSYAIDLDKYFPYYEAIAKEKEWLESEIKE